MPELMNFPSSSPEAQGVPTRAILDFLDEIEREHIELNGMIMMRHGHVIAEGYWSPFSAEKSHRLFSAGKAVMSTAILFAIQEGILHETDFLVDLLPDKLPENPSKFLREITLYHLLTMTTGHAEDTFGAMLHSDGDRARVFMRQPVIYTPGTHFLYNNGVPDMLQIILHKVTEECLFDYLRPRLFEPLGMTGMRIEKNNALDELPTMCSTTWDLMKLTLLYAKAGVWNGKQLLKKELILAAGACQTPSIQSPIPPLVAYDTQFGYGYQIWRNSIGGYRIDGGRSQFGIVVPELDFVMTVQSCEDDQGVIPKLIWKYITNQMYARPLKENPADLQTLHSRLSKLTWAPPLTQNTQVTFGGEYTLDEPFLGCKKLKLSYNDGRLLLNTQGEVSKELTLTANATWKQVEAPFFFDVMRNKQGVRLDRVIGYDPAKTYVCMRVHHEQRLEIHFRSDAWMSAYIITLDEYNSVLRITGEGGISYNLRHRSAEVRHPLLSGLPHICQITRYARLL